MRIYAVAFILLTACSNIFANMSSPYIKGTNMSEAYSSKDIDILSEQINIKIIDAYNAKFTVIYNIRSDKAGKQIPLIFDTMTEYGENNFKIWLDNIEVPVSVIPSTYENPKALRWIDSLDNHLRYPKNDVPNIIGLKYFEVDLSAGKHTIRVEYVALAEQYLGDPVKKYSFRYNLQPARYWRSFSNLSITIDASALNGNLSTDLSKDSEFSGIRRWNFPALPQDTFFIEYTPRINKFASVLIDITPEGLAFIFTLILVALHIYLVLRYRIRYSDKRISPVVIAGGFLVPLIFCFLFIISFSFVDWVIGDHASDRHGYIFLIFFMYPIYIIVYMPIIWLIDYIKKRRILQNE